MKLDWIKSIGTLPRVIQHGLSLLGTEEIPGPKSNEVIMQWAEDLGLDKYTNDDIAWCGLFVAKVCQLAGRDVVPSPLWARNWAGWGEPVTDGAKLADILVFRRGTGGHVGFYIAESADTYFVLGGNQGNEVSIVEIAKSRCIAVRRPKYNNMPESVKKYVVSSSGTVSTNEA